MSSRRWLLWSLVGGVFFALHFMFEFAAWASHPGNSATGRGSAVPWEIASFPLFLLAGHGAALLNSFWILIIVNSLIWSVGLTLAIKRLFR
jgi:hypothetical protein